MTTLRPILGPRWTTGLAALAAAVLLASCGGDQGPAADNQAQAAAPAGYNQVLTADQGATSTQGEFEGRKGYLSQGRTLLQGTGSGTQQASFRLEVPQEGYYEVFAWWPQAMAGAGAVRAQLAGRDASSTLVLDQSVNGGQWNSLGVYALPARGGRLVLSAEGGTRLLADAVRVQWVGTARPELRLATEALAVADRDDEYRAELAAWGGRGPFAYRLAAGRLPDGLTLDESTGRIEGVPAEAGSFELVLEVRDAEGRTARGPVVLEVALSNDTPGSVPAKPFKAQGAGKTRLDASREPADAQLGTLPDLVRSMPEGSWAKVNTNQFADAWVPADLRPLYGSSNPTPAKIITAWSSFAWDSNRGNLLLYGGGHANYRGNEVYLWRASTRQWERASLPSAMVQDTLGNWNAIDSADAAPASAHTYDNTLFFPIIDRMVVVGGAADSNGGHFLRLNPSTGTSRITGFYLFDPARAHPDRVGGSTGSHVQRVAPFPEIVGGNMWSNRETLLNVPYTADLLKGGYVNGCSAYAQEGGKDVAYFRNASSVYRLTISDLNDPSTDVWEKVGAKWFGSGTKATCSYDPHQRVLLRTATQTVPFVFWNMATAAPNNRDVTVVPADPTGTFMPALASGAINIANCGLEYDPQRRNYKLWCGGGTVWQLTPPAAPAATGWSIAPLAVASGAVPDPTVVNGVLGKWKYIDNLDVFMALQDSVQGNVWIYKPVGWVDPGGGGGGGGEPNVPPTVELSQPADGSSVPEGTAIELAASAADTDGTVAKVEFFAGSVRLAERLEAPYAFGWTSAPVGTHVITARATDNTGATTTSAPATVTVTAVAGNLPPTVAVTAPTAGASFTAGTPIALAASASDSDGTVQRVEFYAGIVKVGEALAEPYVATWSGAAVGTHVITAIAYDDDGASSLSAGVTITVTGGGGGGGGGGESTTVTIRREGGGVGTGIADVYLSSYSKNRNYGTADSLLDLSQYNVLIRAAIFQSEGGPVPNGATIEAATLSVYKWSSYAMTYSVHRMLQPWSETASTWNERLRGSPWGTPGGRAAGVDFAAAAEASASVGYEPGWVTFDLTEHLQALSSGVVTVNHGWRLQPISGATSSLKRFYSSEYGGDPNLRPTLEVRYR